MEQTLRTLREGATVCLPLLQGPTMPQRALETFVQRLEAIPLLHAVRGAVRGV